MIYEILNKAEKEFYNACIYQSTLKELCDAMAMTPDSEDMDVWNITQAEWRNAILAAIETLHKEEWGQFDA